MPATSSAAHGWDGVLGGATFLHNPPGMGNHAHAASLLRTRDGGLLATWYAYPDVEHRAASLVIARKVSGEDAWGQSAPLLDGLASSAGNPVLFQERGGRIWVLFVLLKGRYWTDARLEGTSSDDGGRSWSPSMTLWQERGLMVRHPPLQLNSGVWLLPAYDDRSQRAVLLTSAPSCLQWRISYTFEDLPLLQPSLIREPSRLTILFRPWSDPRRIWRSHSTDDGTTWCTPIRTAVPTALSEISAFLHGDRLGVVYNHSHGQERYPLSVSLSADGAVSWSAPKHIDEIPHEVSYPSFLSDDAGGVHGVYTYNRRMIKYVSLDAGWLNRH